jgi:hypothetical protein
MQWRRGLKLKFRAKGPTVLDTMEWFKQVLWRHREETVAENGRQKLLTRRIGLHKFCPLTLSTHEAINAAFDRALANAPCVPDAVVRETSESRVGRDVERDRAFVYVRCTAISCTSLTRVSNRALANASCVPGLTCTKFKRNYLESEGDEQEEEEEREIQFVALNTTCCNRFRVLPTDDPTMQFVCTLNSSGFMW